MKKGLKIFLIIVGLIVVLELAFFIVDYCRVKRQKRPIFCIPSPGIYLDGGTVEYFGLGYKVIDFNRLGGYNEIKIGTWSMKYEDFKEEYEKEPGLILIEQLEAIGFEDGKTVIIKGDNYSTILDILNRQKFDQEINITIDGEDYKTIMDTIQNKIYDEQVCMEYDTYVIRVNGGFTYYISPSNNAIVTNGKQAKISKEDLQDIKDIIKLSNK